LNNSRSDDKFVEKIQYRSWKANPTPHRHPVHQNHRLSLPLKAGASTKPSTQQHKPLKKQHIPHLPLQNAMPTVKMLTATKVVFLSECSVMTSIATMGQGNAPSCRYTKSEPVLLQLKNPKLLLLRLDVNAADYNSF
jgi:hypothetical protein